jgi:hypothetical protein
MLRDVHHRVVFQVTILGLWYTLLLTWFSAILLTSME